MPVSAENSQDDQVNYRQKYKNLKRKLKFLVYEQECFQEELRKSQRKLLKINRDKSFLLDRLLQYECIDQSSSDSEETASSDNASDTEGQKVTTESSKHKKKTASHPPMFNPGTMSGMFGPLGYPQTGAMAQPMMGPSMAGFPGYFPSAQRVKSESPGPGRPRKQQQQRPKKSSTKSSKSKAAKDHGDSSGKGQLSLQMPGPPSATVPHELFSGGSGNPESEQEAPMDESMSSQSLPSDLDDAYDGDDNLVIDIPE
ncbi:INO80 complex subunit [Branchiostoma belcheri]|nr:INO80 complex subunit [Branchiostoma belcheri]